MNDNVPLTSEPVYYPHVSEGTSAYTNVIRLVADDKDFEDSKAITYSITNGNADNLFTIDATAGTYLLSFNTFHFHYRNKCLDCALRFINLQKKILLIT